MFGFTRGRKGEECAICGEVHEGATPAEELNSLLEMLDETVPDYLRESWEHMPRPIKLLVVLTALKHMVGSGANVSRSVSETMIDAEAGTVSVRRRTNKLVPYASATIHPDVVAKFQQHFDLVLRIRKNEQQVSKLQADAKDLDEETEAQAVELKHDMWHAWPDYHGRDGLTVVESGGSYNLTDADGDQLMLLAPEEAAPFYERQMRIRSKRADIRGMQDQANKLEQQLKHDPELAATYLKQADRLLRAFHRDLYDKAHAGDFAIAVDKDGRVEFMIRQVKDEITDTLDEEERLMLQMSLKRDGGRDLPEPLRQMLQGIAAGSSATQITQSAVQSEETPPPKASAPKKSPLIPMSDLLEGEEPTPEPAAAAVSADPPSPPQVPAGDLSGVKVVE